jgi:3-hydroxyisobutyrate dehydrogenase
MSSSSAVRIGFVGLGNMGLPMCLNLALHQDVVAFDLNKNALQEAAAGGAEPVESLEKVGASGCAVIFTMLPGCQAVDAVMPSLFASASTPSIFVDCSTVSPSTSRKWHQEAINFNHTLVDAPVSGGVKGAQDATLTFMVGATDDSTAFHQAQPLLELMGKRVISCGGPGTGAATKLCNNLALAAQMIGICEAMNLGEKLGVDPNTLAGVMNTSTAKCWSSEVNNPHPDVADGTPASNDYRGGFGSKLMLKDLGLAVAAGEEAGVALPLGTTSKELYRLATLRGMGDQDFGVMMQFLKGR